MIKIGLRQLSNPAPIVYKRIVNAMIIFVVPATASLIVAMPVAWMTYEIKVWIGLCTTWFIGLLKAFEFIIGETQQPPEPPK